MTKPQPKLPFTFVAICICSGKSKYHDPFQCAARQLQFVPKNKQLLKALSLDNS